VDTTSLLSAARDGTVRLWSLDGTQLGDPFEGHAPWATSVAVTLDGRHALTTGADATVRTWALGAWPRWLAESCETLSAHPLLMKSPPRDIKDFIKRVLETAEADPSLTPLREPSASDPSPS
jgi:WD40 repeat protein